MTSGSSITRHRWPVRSGSGEESKDMLGIMSGPAPYVKHMLGIWQQYEDHAIAHSPLSRPPGRPEGPGSTIHDDPGAEP
jgi:hypothetical protein